MLRKIHLDFHTPPEAEEIGAGFDPETFADRLANTNVNGLVTPGKCHYGNIYYDSKVGQPHPNLVRPDLFPATVEACNKRGIQVQAYWTLGLDSAVAQECPHWRQTFADGSYANWGHYLHICYASPYVRERVIPELRECMQRCPEIVGFWFDICLHVNGAFYSSYFNDLAEERLGDQRDDVSARWDLARQIIGERCREIDQAIKEEIPDADNYFNTLAQPGEPDHLSLEMYHEVENPIEFQSSEKVTREIRWLRTKEAPVIGLASRFQGPWSDPGTLRSEDQMAFDVARAAALGGHVSMGDHRRPDGTLEPAVYERLAPYYKKVATCEPWLDDAVQCREAVLISDIGRGPGHIAPGLSPLTDHAARLLEQLGLQFDIVTTEETIPDVPLVIWPGETPAGPEFMEQLVSHSRKGGAVLAMDYALEGAEEFFGAHGVRQNQSTANASSADQSDTGDIGHVQEGVAEEDAAGPTGYFYEVPVTEKTSFKAVAKTPTRQIVQAGDTELIASLYPPCTQKPAFPSANACGPAVIQNGSNIYSAVPLFKEEREHGASQVRETLNTLIRRLLGGLMVEHTGGSSVAAHLYRTESGYTLHLLHWAMDRRTAKANPTVEFPTLGPIRVTLRLDAKIEDVRLEPEDSGLSFEKSDEGVEFTVPQMRVWQIIGIGVKT